MIVDIVYESHGETLKIHAEGFFPMSSLHFSNVKRNMKKTIVKTKDFKIIEFFKPTDYE